MKEINFSEDFERESQKDSVYLLEAKILMEQEFHEKLPAEILVIDKENILKKQNEYQGNTLPF